jgi:hypothetical protein
MSRNPDWPYDKEVPVIEASCVPPEGPFANAAVDVFEIGKLMLEFILIECFPAMEQPQFEYSSQVRELVYQCRQYDPKMRPDSLTLLAAIRYERQQLLTQGKLEYVELLS